jgi:hypothetical protein
MMNVTPFFEFILVTVGVGTLAILLTAVLLTVRPAPGLMPGGEEPEQRA